MTDNGPMDDSFYDIPIYTNEQVTDYMSVTQEACIGIFRGTECMRDTFWGTIVARVDSSTIAELVSNGFIKCEGHTIGFLYVRADRYVDIRARDIPIESYRGFKQSYRGI